MIWARFSVVSLFILTIMLERSDGAANFTAHYEITHRVASVSR